MSSFCTWRRDVSVKTSGKAQKTTVLVHQRSGAHEETTNIYQLRVFEVAVVHRFAPSLLITGGGGGGLWWCVTWKLEVAKDCEM